MLKCKVNDNSFDEKIVLSHTDLKKLYSFIRVRECLLSMSDSGFYSICNMRTACRSALVNYNTFRGNLKWYSDRGLLLVNKNKSCFKLNRLEKHYRIALSIYKRQQDAILLSKCPAIFFADLYKSKLMWGEVNRQAGAIASKIDKSSGKKFLETVRKSRRPIGESERIFIPLSKVGELIGKSKQTAWRSVERMNASRIIWRKRNTKEICDVSDLRPARRALELYGRITTKKGIVYERKLNSYFFNLC